MVATCERAKDQKVRKQRGAWGGPEQVNNKNNDSKICS